MQIRKQIVIEVDEAKDTCEFCGGAAEFRIVSAKSGCDICGICLNCIELLRGITKQGE